MIEAVDKALPLICIGFDAFLCLILLLKKRWKSFPAFFVVIFVDLVFTLTLVIVDAMGKSSLFNRWYPAYDGLSTAVQLWLLYEIAKYVLRSTGTWNAQALRILRIAAVVGACVAGLPTFFLQPKNVSGILAVFLRLDLFTGLLTCEIVIAVMIAAKEVGLPWRSHVVAIAQGLMAWALASVSVQVVAVYSGPHNIFSRYSYYFRVAIYLATLIYWSVRLWHEEPVRNPISPALRKYIVALHEQVHYDLGKARH